jgi:outer membrane biosynthesis protein TonB
MQAEKQDNLIAVATTIMVHAALIFILFALFLRTPNPPMGGGSGVVLNLGYVDEGTGEVQTMNDANDSPLNQEAKPQEETPTETNTEEPQPEEPKSNEEEWLASDEETGVQAKKEEKTTPTTPTSEKANQVTEKKNVATQTKEEQKTVSGKVGTETTGGNNNGDKQGKVGDQGNPQGELNAKALYGNPGSGGDGPGGAGGGPVLDMAGWKMDFKIKTDESDENGRLRFKIVVDQEGEVIKIETLEKSVSTAVENYYKRQIENGSFIKEKNSSKVAQNSTGFLTIIIRSK